MKKTHIAMLAVSILLWLIVGLAPVFVIPVFAAMFADFGATLPALTRAGIAVSSIAKSWAIIYLPAFFILLIASSALVADQNRRSHRLALLWSSVLAFFLLLVVLFLPVFQLGAVARELK